MAQLGNAPFADFRKVQDEITKRIPNIQSLEEAAQHYTATIYEHFEESIVLIRYFATVPYEELPPRNKEIVTDFARSKEVSQLLHPHTPILSLLGTSGMRPEWNHRKQSQGHMGIPLVSSVFIDAIPMMSRLLQELGIGLDWLDSHDSKIAEKTMGVISGLFFVPEAANEVDKRGRKIIAAQDFVAKYSVRTVFGFGGGYIGTKSMVVTIMFLREVIQKKQAELFASSMIRFRTMTGHLLKTQIFMT